jgi:predicted alpha/beta superfamily hydrolase
LTVLEPAAGPGLPTWRGYSPGRHTVVGALKVLEGVWSPQLGNRRDLYVHLPPSYPDGRPDWPVLYFQDGQNLFDAYASYAGEWQVDETMTALAREGVEAVVVGVANRGRERIDEYAPFYEPAVGGGKAAAYLQFLVETVKPLIDAEFKTARDRARTGLVGSSLGGLLALWALFERPRVFGLVAALSPSVLFARGALNAYLAGQPRVEARVYLDVGTLEGPPGLGGALLARLLPRPYVSRVRETRRLLASMGYRAGEDLLYVEERGGRHNEACWSRRLPDALRFLLRPPLNTGA